jgi:hypothetical protein
MSVKLMTVNEMTTAIGRIKAGSASLQSRIHTTAVSTLAHIRDHGDTTLACRLLDALATGQRVKSLAFWYGHFSGKMAVFSIDKASGQWKCKLAPEWNQSKFLFDIDGANETTFADLTVEKSPETMDVKAFLKMLKRVGDNDGFFPGTTMPKVDPEVRRLAALAYAKVASEAVSVAA